MKVLVAKPFPYSADGLRVTDYFSVGDEPDINEAVVPGLESEGYIVVNRVAPASAVVEASPELEMFPAPVTEPEKPAEAPIGSPEAPKADVVQIPDDWRSMKWFKLKTLASKISGIDVKSPEEAKGLIEAELAKRAGK
jgi:hypothetical protein